MHGLRTEISQQLSTRTNVIAGFMDAFGMPHREKMWCRFFGMELAGLGLELCPERHNHRRNVRSYGEAKVPSPHSTGVERPPIPWALLSLIRRSGHWQGRGGLGGCTSVVARRESVPGKCRCNMYLFLFHNPWGKPQLLPRLMLPRPRGQRRCHRSIHRQFKSKIQRMIGRLHLRVAV